MKQTNWNIISLLPNHTNQKLFNEAEYDGEYDFLLNKGKNYSLNKNYYKYKNNHNSIEAYTVKQLNLISVDIDYAFLCCKLFIELYKTSSLCTLTKNGFHFHYKYNDKLRTSRSLKNEYGFDIKNNTVIKIPQSYYNDTNGNRFTYYFLRYNNPSDMPEYVISEINSLINIDTPIESLSNLNKQKLTDETFIIIINMIPKYKASNHEKWKKFGRICALLQYPLEYFDYFLQKDNCCGANNIDEYNKIYERAFNNRYKKDEKFQDIQKEIYYGNNILECWINKNPYYFKEIKIQIIKFSCKQVATYMLNKMNKAKLKYIN